MASSKALVRQADGLATARTTGRLYTYMMKSNKKFVESLFISQFRGEDGVQ